VFLLSQGLTRIPLVQLMQAQITPLLQTSPTALWVWLVCLAVSAGVFEEVGRYLGYRFLVRHEVKTWSKAVMFGLGHGGLESMVLTSSLTVLMLFNVQSLISGGTEQLAADQRARVAEQLATISAQPWFFPFLAAFERLWTLPIQVALSVLVLQVFVRRKLVWLWIAICVHALVDLVAVAVPQVAGTSVRTMVLSELIVAVWRVLALFVLWRLRETSTTAPSVGPLPHGAAAPDLRPSARGI